MTVLLVIEGSIARPAMSMALTPEAFFRLCTRTGALLVAATGVAVLMGWALDNEILKGVMPGFVTMKPNTALTFFTLGTALLCLSDATVSSKVILLGRVLGALVAIFTFLTLCEYVFEWNFGIDYFLFRGPTLAEARVYPGRMAPVTAFNALVLSIALMGLTARRSFYSDRAHWLALPVFFSGVLSLLGYIFDVSSLYKIGNYASMALHTAILFCVLAVCIYVANCSRGFMKIVVSDSVGGSAARRLIPPIPVIILALSWVCLEGERTGLFSGRFGLAIMTAMSMAVLTLFVARVTVALHRSDLERQEAEAEILALNESLELRVKERTRLLENSLMEVKQLSGMLPICSYCKKVRDDKDYWHTVENFVMARTDARFSHGICPSCVPRARAEAGLKPLPV